MSKSSKLTNAKFSFIVFSIVVELVCDSHHMDCHRHQHGELFKQDAQCHQLRCDLAHWALSNENSNSTTIIQTVIHHHHSKRSSRKGTLKVF